MKKPEKASPKTIIKALTLGEPIAPDRPKDQDNRSKEWVYFGDDNLFPQDLNRLAKRSVTHGSILADKVTYSTGPFLFDNPRADEFGRNVNSIGDSIEDIYRRVVSDWYKYGNAYVEFVKSGKLIVPFHVDAESVRAGKIKDGLQVKDYFVSPDWTKAMSTAKPKMVQALEQGQGILHLKRYHSGNFYYGLPEYLHALNEIDVEGRISIYNLSQFENGFMPSGVMVVYGEAKTEEEAEAYVNKFNQKLVGAENGSKVVFIFKDSPESGGTEWQPLNTNHEGGFLELSERVRANIIAGHRWKPQLLGIETAGKLGSAKEMRDAFQVVMNTVILEAQRVCFKVVDTFYKLNGIDAGEIEIQSPTPVNFSGDLEPKMVLTVNEQREELGFEAIEGGDVLLKNGNNNSSPDQGANPS